MQWGTNAVGAALRKIQWETLKYDKTQNAIYHTYQGVLKGRPILKKTMKLRLKNGEWSASEKEWYIYNGARWTSCESLALCLMHENAEERKEEKEKTRYK